MYVMYVYANLDIVTAKATKEEQKEVPHHLLDVATPSNPFTVVRFRNQALPIIDNLLKQSKCPIIVGGTNYYIESILWDILVNASEDSYIESTVESNEKWLTTTSEELHEELKKVDPKYAQMIHPNNKRKIVRALDVFKRTGIPLSEILKDQRNKPGGNRLGGPLRYPHTILFWLRCNQDVLNDRLNKRVDSMLKQGLLKEIRNFYNIHFMETKDDSYTKGILQSIGFKEFIPYLKQFDSNHDEIIGKYLKENNFQIKEDCDQNKPEGMTILLNCLEELKLVTQRYSKKQIKWIKNRFLASKDRQVPPIYKLDTSDVNQWENEVQKKAIHVIETFIEGKSCTIQPLKHIKHPGSGLNEEVTNYCEVCKRHFIGEFQWGVHLKSNKHKKRKDSNNKKLKMLQNEEISKLKK
ncbi:tRNA dimethylallyltransferase isoform X2 [Condylostylus longicornis]|uniref:tRNA dimethylallyltransferase isoform X2 n=1 Tax=Condylostylus longicornis TaxID=2530218 RepID=UPI00244D9989|nr:tRNA dimethylallyltransferase isoform X2 [Condylostylus longicornis]